MARSKKTDDDPDVRVVCSNRRARFLYSVEESFEAGLVLAGTEVKSLRDGKAQLKDSYCVVEGGEVFLIGCHISPYNQASAFNHSPERKRKLLLNKREIHRLSVRVHERGQTLVPLRIYFRGAHAKIEIALVRGKAQRDRRDDIRRRDLDREQAREERS